MSDGLRRLRPVGGGGLRREDVDEHEPSGRLHGRASFSPGAGGPSPPQTTKLTSLPETTTVRAFSAPSR
jgi:hypothetical protein